jgi:hypothetical protein
VPQRDEGITACKWVGLEEGLALVSYANAREVLRRAAQLMESARREGQGAPAAGARTGR